jgi:RNA polymerase sigma factor (sigma-70 family)
MADSEVARFEASVLPYLDDAYTLARYLVHHEHDAQDVVQDAVLRAYKYFDGFRQGDARAWLLSIVRNCCYNWHGRHRRDRASISLTDDASLAVADPGAADDRAIRRSEQARVRQAIDALPVDLREVIVLREIGELSYREIAEVAGVPVGTVMSRLSRARERLAALLGVGAQEAS